MAQKSKRRSQSYQKDSHRSLQREKSEEQSYEYHLPVMLSETLNLLVTNPSGLYIDGTLGGGGHAAHILALLAPTGRLFGFDADETAISHCRGAFATELSKEHNSRIVLVHSTYSAFTLACTKEEKNENLGNDGSIRSSLRQPHQNDAITNASTIRGIDGMLLDLGVSSRQLDSGERGISFRFDGPLDMRFGGSAEIEKRSADDIINNDDEQRLTTILRQYGEEPFARPIAKALVRRRTTIPLRTTSDLRTIVEEIVPPHMRAKSLARVFQAFRIAVNQELDVLDKTLRNAVKYLSVGGRIVVITYHSLEDRVVKNVFRDVSTTIHARMPGEATLYAPCRHLTQKPLLPMQEEVLRNPRARSAKIRAIEKVDESSYTKTYTSKRP